MIIKQDKHNLVSNNLLSDSDFVTNLKNFIAVYEESKTIQIPIGIFSNKLGILESVVKYLKENLNLRYNEIATYLNRDQRTIWATYSKAVKKNKTLLEIKGITIPITVFSNRNIGPLESIVAYLKDKSHLELKEISKLLNREYQTIWISYKNAIKKEDK